MCWSESSHSKFWKHLGEAKTMSSELLSIKLSERGQLLWWWRDLALPEQNWHMGNVAIKLSMLSSSQFPKSNRSSKQTWYNSWAGKHVVQNDIIVNYIAYSHHDTRDSDWFWLSPQMIKSRALGWRTRPLSLQPLFHSPRRKDIHTSPLGTRWGRLLGNLLHPHSA